MIATWWGLASPAEAGRLFAVPPPDPDAAGAATAERAFVQVESGGPTETLVTWPGRPVELVFVADLTGSVLADFESAWQMADAMVAAFDVLGEDPRAGDAIGVVAYADRAVEWIPLGAVDRGGLRERLASFNAPFVPAARGRSVELLAWSSDRSAAPAARALGYRRAADSPQKGVREALRALGPPGGPGDPLRVVVLLWDGGQFRARHLQRVLDRAEAADVDVFTIGFGAGVDCGWFSIAARGAGDAYLGVEHGALAMRRIASELRVDRAAEDELR